MCMISVLALVSLSAYTILRSSETSLSTECDAINPQDIANMSNVPRVVIIGAGAAGLAAASRLLRSGFVNVTILEASNRTGGRIRSVPAYADRTKNAYLELGAQWIHGEVANVAFKLASDAGIVNPNSATEDELDEHFVFEGENRYIREELSGKFEELIEEVDEKSDEFQASPGLSYGTYCNDKFSEFSAKFSDKEKKYLGPIKDFYHRYVRSYDGCDNWYDLSFKGSVKQFQLCEGNQLVSFKKNAKYEDIVQVFKNDIPYSNIHLETVVSKIDYSSSEVVKVVTESGKEYEADIVIVTSSLGYLKTKAKELFTPALPDVKMSAIETIGFGVVNKIFLEFAKPLQAQTDGIKFLFNDTGIAYSSDDAKADWTRFIIGAYVEEHPKIMSLWLSGEGARKMETLSDEQVKEDVKKLLEKFLGRMTAFRNILDDPINIIRSAWATTPYVFGSYSYQTVESELKGVGPETLAKPVGDNRVLFAGEATHEKYFSTVHGAIESGWREADRLICGLTQN